MQTRTKTSLAIWTAFDNMTTAVSRVLKHVLNISWKRAEKTTSFAVVGTSVVNGLHIVQGASNVLMPLDSYEYFDETDRLVTLTYDRVLQEVLGGISQAIMDIELDNTDDKFTPEQNSTIGTAILPKRPIHAEVGFLVQSQTKTIPVFRGLTLQPKIDETRKLIRFTCVDLVGYLYGIPMDSELYVNQRTDQIVEDILTTLGFGSSQYSLDVGINTIPYAWFDKSQTAGERIKKLCESEGAYFYSDENGILRFENRNHFAVSPHNVDVWDIDPDDIIAWESDESTPIYNVVTVKGKPRQEQATAVIWESAEEPTVAGSSGETIIWANLSEPITECTSPVASVDFLAYTGAGGTGSNITSDQIVTIETFATAVKITLHNNNASLAYYSLLQLRGKEALAVGDITETEEDATSINNYDEQTLVVENDFIESSEYANTLATE